MHVTPPEFLSKQAALYLGRSAEAAAESGTGGTGESGQHGWSGRGTDRQAQELREDK